jgi:hypothetical protein
VDGEVLTGDGVLVFEAGVADVALADAKGGGDAFDGVGGGAAAFLDLQEEVLALAGGLVEREFLDDEVLGALLDRAPDARQVGREQRRVEGGVVGGGARVNLPARRGRRVGGSGR